MIKIDHAPYLQYSDYFFYIALHKFFTQNMLKKYDYFLGA
jgi:hypothetical protein